MNFRKTSEGGGEGVISDPKKFVADFFGNFEGKKQWFFGKRGVGHSNPKNFVAKSAT